MARTPWLRAAVAAVVVLLAGLGGSAPAMAAAVPAETGADRPVVLIGIPGLAWSDVPEGSWLDQSAGSGELAVGSLVVRSTDTVACPVDGWLAISAGNRASGSREGGCQAPAEPVGGEVPQWTEYLDRAANRSFAAQPGLFGDSLAAAGVTTTALGAGAAVALADSSGHVDNYQQYTEPDQLSQALTTSDLVIVDLGADLLATAGPAPADGSDPTPLTPDVDAALTQVQALVEAAQASGTDPVVLISGVSDEVGAAHAELRVLAVAGLGPGQVNSPSTRQPGYVLATDLQASLLDLLGLPAAGASAIGAPMQVVRTPGDLVAAALDRERHADAQRPMLAAFTLGLVVINLGLFGVVALGLRRPGLARTVAPRPEPVLRWLRAGSLGVAGLPVSSFLANLLPWWRAEVPPLALVGAVLAIDVALVTVALLRPWSRSLLGPAAVVAGVTAAVLGLDVIFGARLQVSAAMGISTLVAGRFYGMNNTSFALFSASLIILATAVANSLVTRGRRRLAVLAIAVIGVVGIVIDGAPFLGADFGGPPAMLIAFALLGLLAAGVRLTVRRVVLVGVIAVVMSATIAFLDWLRPPDARTHLGRFFADVLDGDLWTVVGRKLDQNLSILLGNRPLTILAICGVLFVVVILVRPVRRTIASPDGGEYAWLSGGAPISQMSKRAPLLGAGLIALAVCGGIGFAINDSGIAIPAIAVTVAVPLLLASCATWMLDPRRELASRPAPHEGS